MAWKGSKRKDELRGVLNSRGEKWEELRKRILERDAYECQNLRGGRLCRSFASDVDHIIPGMNHDDDNLRAMCTICHRRKTSAEGRAGKMKTSKRPEQKHPGFLGPL